MFEFEYIYHIYTDTYTDTEYDEKYLKDNFKCLYRKYN